MPISRSWGYPGSIHGEQWARSVWRLGLSRYGVAGASDWAPTPVPGDRTVQIGPGAGWGRGVYDEMDAPHTFSLDPVASGSRWDMIVAHRNWDDGESTLEVINGSSARQLPPRDIGYPTDDQPIALCMVTAGQSVVQVVDLRCVVGVGGMVAFDDLARSYLSEIGTTIRIASSVWSRALDAVRSPVWESSAVGRETAPISQVPERTYLKFDWPDYAPGQVSLEGPRVFMRGLMSNSQPMSVAAGGHYRVGTIPARFAPAVQASFPTFTGSGAGPSTLSVYPSGEVWLDTYYAASGFSPGFFICWLDGFSWPAKSA